MNDTSRADWVWNNTPNEDLARDLFNLSRQLERELAERSEVSRKMIEGLCELRDELKAQLAEARDGALQSVRDFLLAQYQTSNPAAEVLDALEEFLKSPAPEVK